MRTVRIGIERYHLISKVYLSNQVHILSCKCDLISDSSRTYISGDTRHYHFESITQSKFVYRIVSGNDRDMLCHFKIIGHRHYQRGLRTVGWLGGDVDHLIVKSHFRDQMHILSGKGNLVTDCYGIIRSRWIDRCFRNYNFIVTGTSVQQTYQAEQDCR